MSRGILGIGHGGVKDDTLGPVFGVRTLRHPQIPCPRRIGRVLRADLGPSGGIYDRLQLCRLKSLPWRLVPEIFWNRMQLHHQLAIRLSALQTHV